MKSAYFSSSSLFFDDGECHFNDHFHSSGGDDDSNRGQGVVSARDEGKWMCLGNNLGFLVLVRTQIQFSFS